MNKLDKAKMKIDAQSKARLLQAMTQAIKIVQYKYYGEGGRSAGLVLGIIKSGISDNDIDYFLSSEFDRHCSQIPEHFNLHLDNHTLNTGQFAHLKTEFYAGVLPLAKHLFYLVREMEMRGFCDLVCPVLNAHRNAGENVGKEMKKLCSKLGFDYDFVMNSNYSRVPGLKEVKYIVAYVLRHKHKYTSTQISIFFSSKHTGTGRGAQLYRAAEKLPHLRETLNELGYGEIYHA